MSTTANSLGSSRGLAPIPKRLPITVVIVVKEISDYGNKDVQAIRQYCQELNIMVESRKYDSYRYNHDRDEVRQLPAFHIYENTKYLQTFYLHGRPYQIIHTVVHNFKRTCEERMARRSGWKKYISSVWGRVCGVFKRQTRLRPEPVVPSGPRSTVLKPTPALPPRRHSIGVAREVSKSAPASVWSSRMGLIDMD